MTNSAESSALELLDANLDKVSKELNSLVETDIPDTTALFYWNQYKQMQDDYPAATIYNTQNYSTPAMSNLTTYRKNNAVTTPPGFEFQYLKSQSSNKSVPSAQPIPLISSAAAAHAAEHQQLLNLKKCPGCYRITTVCSYIQGIAVCAECARILSQPTVGHAKPSEGYTFRRKPQ